MTKKGPAWFLAHHSYKSFLPFNPKAVTRSMARSGVRKVAGLSMAPMENCGSKDVLATVLGTRPPMFPCTSNEQACRAWPWLGAGKAVGTEALQSGRWQPGGISRRDWRDCYWALKSVVVLWGSEGPAT